MSDKFDIDAALKKYNDRREELRGDPINKLFEVLKELIIDHFGGDVNALEPTEEKEGLYLIKYIQGIIGNALEYHKLYKRLPLFQYTLFGDHTGRSLVDMYMSPDMEMVEGFQLRKLAQMLIDETDKWGAMKESNPDDLPPLEMGKITIEDMDPYSALKDMLKKPPADSDGSEEDKND
jgi:hypothetical protein